MRWMAWLAALCVAAVALTGCAQPKADDGEPSPTTPPKKERLSRPGSGSDAGDDEEDEEAGRDEDLELFHFREEFDLTVTGATALINFGGFDGQNCVAIEGTPFRILGGNATLTWTAQSAAADQLMLTTRQAYGDYYYSERGGRSPLDLRIPKLPVAEDDSYFVFSADPGQPAGAALDQPVHLVLEFEYEAEDEVTVGPYC